MTRLWRSIVAAILGVSGFVLIGLVDWRIALGVFLVAFGGNIENGIKYKRQ